MLGYHPPPAPGTPSDQAFPGPGNLPPEAEHAGRYGQRAGGTHPTGMQSCNDWIIVHKDRKIKNIETTVRLQTNRPPLNCVKKLNRWFMANRKVTNRMHVLLFYLVEK